MTSTTTDTATLARVTADAAEAAPVLAATGLDDRAALLRQVADAIDEALDDLVAIADEETALGPTRLRGEVARTTGQLRLFANVLLEGSFLEAAIDHADQGASPPRPDVRRLLHPIGPVAVFSASNFPFAFSVAGGDSASALAAGCPVVVKAHSGHPRLSEATAAVVRRALADAGAPDGTFACVEGRDIGRALVLDPHVRAVGFTGSLSGGRALFDLAVSRPDPIPFYGELGSINPVLITHEAAHTRAAELAAGLVGSFTLGVGQFCTKPGVVLVPAGTALEDEIAAAVSGVAGGRMLTGRIAEGFAGGLSSFVATGRAEVVAGDADQTAGDGMATPVVLATTVEDLAAAPDVLLEECFGPATLLVRYLDDDDRDRALEHLPGSLTVAIHAEPGELADLATVVERLRSRAGRVIFGGWPTGVAVNWAMHHGGPWPATTAPLFTSVGATAIRRFLRPVAYQDVPQSLLPPALRDDNPLGIPRRVDGQLVLP